MTVQELKLAHLGNKPMKFDDPVGVHRTLPFRATFFPLGFPVDVHTNSPTVLDCAAESWLGYPHLFRRNPLQLHVLVQEAGTSDCPPAPTIRAHGHLLMNVADAHHYSAADLREQSAWIATSPSALGHRGYFRYFFLEAATLSLIASHHATAIHAACVELNGIGVLLCGDSGAGKSTLAYACAREGWTYITDDASFLIRGRTDRMVVGNFRQVRFRPSATSLFPQLDGLKAMRRAEVGKPSIELSTSTHRDLKRAPTTHIRHMVFLSRAEVRQPSVDRFPPEVARQYLLQTSFLLPRFASDDQSHIESLLELPAVELRYRDLRQAISRLVQLTKDGPP